MRLIQMLVCTAALVMGCSSPSAGTSSQQAITNGVLDCCVGTCSSEKGTGPVLNEEGDFVCPEGSVSAESCGRPACKTQVVCDSPAPSCCEGGCAGPPMEPYCAFGKWNCPGNSTPASSCTGGVCEPSACDDKPRFYCCRESCTGDVGVGSLCVDGEWVCPEGSVSRDSCPTDRVFCGGPGPGPNDGG